MHSVKMTLLKTPSPHLTILTWLALASLVPAQNTSAPPISTDEILQLPDLPDLPEPSQPIVIPSPDAGLIQPNLQIPSTELPALPKPEEAQLGLPDLPPLAPGSTLPSAPQPFIPGQLPDTLPPADFPSSLTAPPLPGQVGLTPPPEVDPLASIDSSFDRDTLEDDSRDSNDDDSFDENLTFESEIEDEREGFTFGTNLTLNYNSNLDLVQDELANSSVFTTFSPSVTYRSALENEAVNIIVAEYLAALNFYHTGGFEDNIDQSFRFDYQHTGSRGNFGFDANYEIQTESNRFTQDFTESKTLTLGSTLNYEYSALTSFYAQVNFTSQSNDSDQEESGDSDLFDLQIGALWEVTPLLNLGPSLRYALNQTGSFGDTESTALSLEARYRPLDRLRLTANAGLEASDSDVGSSEINPTFTTQVNYAPNDRWRLTGEFRYETIPVSALNGSTFDGLLDGNGFSNLNGASADGGPQVNWSLGAVYSPSDLWRFSGTLARRTSPSFVVANQSLTDTSLNFQVMRRLQTAVLSARYSYSMTDTEGDAPASNLISLDDQDFHEFGITYNNPDIFRRISFNAGLSYLTSNGGLEYDQTSALLSFGYIF